MNKKRKATLTSVAGQKSVKASEAEPLDGAGQRQARTAFVARTELGRRLWTIRQKIVVSGQSLLDWEDIESELRERRGEATEEA